MTFFNSHLAKTPPMGWNSWDCFCVTVNEQEFLENAEFIAQHLRPYGWEYVVLDLGWYAPGATHETYKQPNIPVEIDEFGRFMPCPDKFPSSKNGAGLKPLADYVHRLGLKFGLHIMRGIPLKAVLDRTPVKGAQLNGAPVTADKISYESEACPWFNSMRTLNFALPQAQAYYNSIFELYAHWGVDYIKADDLNSWHEVHNSDGSPTGTGSPYRIDDIEAISHAIRHCGRDMILSLSPGGADITNINHLRKHANLWRISADFWDEWGSLKKQMERCANWAPFTMEGHWPDADMLPIGALPRGESGGLDRVSNFTTAELHSLMTLWCICRSPLMIGADLPNTDEATIELLTNADAIAVNQRTMNNSLLSSAGGIDIWSAQSTDSPIEYFAFINKNDTPARVQLNRQHLTAEAGNEILKDNITDIWQRYPVSLDEHGLTIELRPHDAVLLKHRYSY